MTRFSPIRMCEQQAYRLAIQSDQAKVLYNGPGRQQVVRLRNVAAAAG